MQSFTSCLRAVFRLVAAPAPTRSGINATAQAQTAVSQVPLDQRPTPEAGFRRPIDQVFQFAHLLTLCIKVVFLAPGNVLGAPLSCTVLSSPVGSGCFCSPDFTCS